MRRTWMGIIVAVALAATTVLASAAPPQRISFQARVTLPDGTTAIADGPHNFVFTMYNALGIPAWSETQVGIPTSRGLFTTLLGISTPFPTSPALAWDTTYTLGLAVDGGAEMAPRYTLASSPYSLDNKWTAVRGMQDHVRVNGTAGDSIWFGIADTAATGLFLHQHSVAGTSYGADIQSNSSLYGSYGVHGAAQYTGSLNVNYTVGVIGLALSTTQDAEGGEFMAWSSQPGAYAMGIHAYASAQGGSTFRHTAGVYSTADIVGTVADTAFGIWATASATAPAIGVAANFQGLTMVNGSLNVVGAINLNGFPVSSSASGWVLNAGRLHPAGTIVDSLSVATTLTDPVGLFVRNTQTSGSSIGADFRASNTVGY